MKKAHSAGKTRNTSKAGKATSVKKLAAKKRLAKKSSPKKSAKRIEQEANYSP